MRGNRPIVISAVVAAVLVGALMGAGIAIAAGSDSNGPSSDSGAAEPAAAPARPLAMEDTFVPITPCRIIDTRAGGGQFTPGTARDFLARGTAGFPAQGGTAGGCGIPMAATSIMVSVSSVTIGGTGYFRAYPYGGAVPNATIAHYQLGPITTTGATITLGPSGAAFDLTIKAFDAPASIVVDVTGYYAPQMAAFVAENGTLTFASPRVIASTQDAIGRYTVTFDSDVSQCSFQATPYAFNYAVAVGPTFGNADQATVFIHDQDSAETPHDTSFFILAVC